MMTDNDYSLATVSFILLLTAVPGTLRYLEVGGSLSEYDSIGPRSTLWKAAAFYDSFAVIRASSLPYILLFSIVVFIRNFVQCSTNPFKEC